MIDVGSTATLTVNPRDDTDDPLAVTNLRVSLTLPDGTIAGPFTPAGGAGAYSYSYVTAQAGRHVVRWSGDGYAHSDVLNVWPADPRFLISLDDAKRSLRRRWSESTSDDDDLRLYIAAVTPVIEDIVGPVGAQTFTQTFNGGEHSVSLRWPNATVTALTVNGTASTDYTVDTTAGIVYFGNQYSWSLSHWPRGVQNIEVTYTAGLATVPPNLILAVKEELRFLWQIGQQNNTSNAGSGFPDDTEFTPSGFAVPRRVIELCSPHARGPVIA